MTLNIGDKIGKLTILCIEKEIINRQHRIYCLCRCECGNEKRIRMDSITRKNGVRSCGCLTREKSKERNSTHKMTHSITYQSWQSMRNRCNNPQNPSYTNYGGIGITICERWNDFENFLLDMGERPSKEYTLDRINVNGDYEPCNCRWATQLEQQNNKRNNRTLTCYGETHTVSEWARILDIKDSIIYTRIRRNKTPEQCLSIVDNRKFHFK